MCILGFKPIKNFSETDKCILFWAEYFPLPEGLWAGEEGAERAPAPAEAKTYKSDLNNVELV